MCASPTVSAVPQKDCSGFQDTHTAPCDRVVGSRLSCRKATIEGQTKCSNMTERRPADPPLLPKQRSHCFGMTSGACACCSKSSPQSTRIDDVDPLPTRLKLHQYLRGGHVEHRRAQFTADGLRLPFAEPWRGAFTLDGLAPFFLTFEYISVEG